MFGQKTPNNSTVISPRLKFEQQYKMCRRNLLAVILFTIISMATLYLNGSYFLFSAWIPLLAFSVCAGYASISDGTVSAAEAAEYGYTPDMIEMLQEVGAGTWMIIGIIIAVVILAVYFVCWLCSKKHPAAMVVAACFFAIDCIALLTSFDLTMIVDILFHVWVMYYLIAAIVASSKLKKLPPEEEAPVEAAYTVINGENLPSATATPVNEELAEVAQNEQPASNDENTPSE